MSNIFRNTKESENKKSTRYFSKRQEDAVAKSIGGRTTPNSGATMFAPGDVSNDKYLIECKTKMTHADSISIKKDWLLKLKEEAAFAGKEFEALFFNFGPDEENYVIISEDLFNMLNNTIKEFNDR